MKTETPMKLFIKSPLGWNMAVFKTANGSVGVDRSWDTRRFQSQAGWKWNVLDAENRWLNAEGWSEFVSGSLILEPDSELEEICKTIKL